MQTSVPACVRLPSSAVVPPNGGVRPDEKKTTVVADPPVLLVNTSFNASSVTRVRHVASSVVSLAFERPTRAATAAPIVSR